MRVIGVIEKDKHVCWICYNLKFINI